MVKKDNRIDFRISSKKLNKVKKLAKKSKNDLSNYMETLCDFAIEKHLILKQS